MVTSQYGEAKPSETNTPSNTAFDVLCSLIYVSPAYSMVSGRCFKIWEVQKEKSHGRDNDRNINVKVPNNH